MKKTLLLLAVATLATSFTGCGCCRRFRDLLCRGAFCGTSSAVAPAAIMAAPPMAYSDPACSYPTPVAYDDANCAYGTPVTYGYAGEADCAVQGYSLPSGGYETQGVITTPSGGDPGPAN